MTEQAPAGSGRCPICGNPRDQRFRPFCSRACRDRDLINWLDGVYAVPAVDDEEDPPQDDASRSSERHD
jgi:endogenous inhibitor of DNA gyrase (YacG/DUF329 family)